MSDDEFEPIMNMLNSRTSLEELLDWDYDLVEYLVGAWAVVSRYVDSAGDKHLLTTLLAAQLPADKREKYQEKLEKWLLDNYNMLVR